MPRTRRRDALRPIDIQVGFLASQRASVVYACGRTKVLCTATLSRGVPLFLEGKGRGWATAEYDMLPAATTPRRARERAGKLSGRTQEIQRLIGRSLRAVLDLAALDGLTLQLDCDVLEADGGTRTASINGAWIAASIAVAEGLREGLLLRSPLTRCVGAVSVGIVDGEVLLDLDYAEDSSADVDLNLVLAESEEIIEVQGTSEGRPFSRERLGEMLDVATRGIAEIRERQREAVAGA